MRLWCWAGACAMGTLSACASLVGLGDQPSFDASAQEGGTRDGGESGLEPEGGPSTCVGQAQFSLCISCCVSAVDGGGQGYTEYHDLLGTCLCGNGQECTSACSGSECSPPPDEDASSGCSSCVHDASSPNGTCGPSQIGEQCTSGQCRGVTACFEAASCFALKGP
jgi:hypothetical protein